MAFVHWGKPLSILIVGSGLGGVTLAEELRKLAPEKPIHLVTQETHGYYARPMLSHAFTRDDIEEKIILKSFDALRALGIMVDEGWTVTAIDPSKHQVSMERSGTSQTLDYQTLVLAQGSEAFVPAPFRPFLPHLLTVNSLDDVIALRRLRANTLAQGEKPRWALIGGGLIGCEVASDMARAGDDVTLIHPLPKLMERQLEDEDAVLLQSVLEQQGVKVLTSTTATEIQNAEDRKQILTDRGMLGPFDGVLLCTGFKPRTQLAEAAGIQTGRGIKVDPNLRTSINDIYAVGDAVEIEDGRVFAYILPVRQQASWLARHLSGESQDPWTPPDFKPRAKVQGFTANHPYKN